MQIDHSAVLRLAISDGGIRNTTLTPWETDFAGLAATLSAPVIGPKDGSYFVRASGTKRSDKDVNQTGWAVVLDGDSRLDPETGEILAGAPDPQMVHAALEHLAIPHIIYSSHSNGKTEAAFDAFNAAEQARHDKALAEGKKSKLELMNTGGAYGEGFHKWRCIIPCEHAKADLPRLVTWLVEQLHTAGVMLRNVKENTAWAQAWFLPRVPDEARLRLFKCYASEPGIWTAPAVEQSAPAVAVEPAVEVEQSAHVPAVPAVTAATVPGRISAIDYFNSKWSIGQVLEPAGYTRPNPRVDEWLRPGSTSGQAGVKICPERTKERGVQIIYSHHGDGDPLADGHAHDAFDCMRILFCDGDEKRAIAHVHKAHPELKADQLADYFAPGEEQITVKDACSAAAGALNAIGAMTPFDPGALLDPKLVGWLAVVKAHDPANWLRLDTRIREMTKGKTGQATAVFKAVDARNKERQAAVARAALERHAAPAVINYAIPVEPGFLVTINANGQPVIVKESVGAERMIRYLQGLLAFDAGTGSWYTFARTHWQLLDIEHGPSFVLQPLARIGCADVVGFSAAWLLGVIRLMEGSGALPLPAFSQSSLPFLNGILDLDTRVLTPTTPANAQDWCLPYNYDPTADCPGILDWLNEVMDGDRDMVDFLTVVAAVVLRGGMGSMQVFIHLLGMAGTGKSTYLGLLEQMVGAHNCEATTMSTLEGDKFETASFNGKRLVSIADMEEWSGKVDTLKGLTGGDRMRNERKYKNKGRSFTYRGAVVILSNKHLTSTDKSNGLQRRRRTIKFDNVLTGSQKVKWRSEGGDAAKLHSQLPGFINHLLTLTPEYLLERMENPPDGVLSANLEAQQANNSVAAWLIACCKPGLGAQTLIGNRKEITLHAPLPGGTGTRSWKAFENSQTCLYPNYLTWCMEHGVKVPQTHINFARNVRETLHSFGYAADAAGQAGERNMHGRFIRNVSLKEAGDNPETDYFVALPDWLKS